MEKFELKTGWEHYLGSLGGPWEVWRGEHLKNHYNVPWDEVELPHCFNNGDEVDPDRLYYQGPGWYRTRLEIKNPYSAGRTLLHFEGAGQKTDLFMFTRKAGSHAGGYDEFRFDITDVLRELHNDGEFKRLYPDRIPVAVRCTNSRDLELVPSDISDFNLYGGLYRPVNLLYAPAVSFQRMRIASRAGRRAAEIAVSAELYNPGEHAEPLRLRVVIESPGGKPVFQRNLEKTPRRGIQKLLEVNLPDPELWSPDCPALYRCRILLESEHGSTEISERFGLRFFEFVKNGPFLLNGDRLLLRGTHRHQDQAGSGGAETEEMVKKEFGMIKEMGCNFVRLGHYQQWKRVLELCDELGIMVWEEIPWCRGGLGGAAYRERLRSMLRNMIRQHENHPSIIIWGLGNENDWESDFMRFDKDDIRQFMSELHEIAREEDPSRLTGIRRCEFCRDIVDVYSPSIWSGWNGGVYTDYEKDLKDRAGMVERFLHMEWGASNLAGRHVEKPVDGMSGNAFADQNPEEQDGDFFRKGGRARIARDGDWSETYFCDLCDWYLRTHESLDFLAGSAQWVFKDFSTPVRPENPIPYVNLKGIVARDMKPKEAYYVFRSYWSKEPMVHIYGPPGMVRWGGADEAKRVRVYSNCDSVEITVNREKQAPKERDPGQFPACGLYWDVKLRAGENIITARGRAGSSVVEDTRRFNYQVESWGEPAALVLEQAGRKDSRICIESRVLDKNGVFCPDDRDMVRFSLAGEARLLDNLGTPEGSRVMEMANGKARIWLEIKEGGRAVAAVSRPGLQPGFLVLYPGKNAPC